MKNYIQTCSDFIKLVKKYSTNKSVQSLLLNHQISIKTSEVIQGDGLKSYTSIYTGSRVATLKELRCLILKVNYIISDISVKATLDIYTNSSDFLAYAKSGNIFPYIDVMHQVGNLDCAIYDFVDLNNGTKVLTLNELIKVVAKYRRERVLN